MTKPTIEQRLSALEQQFAKAFGNEPVLRTAQPGPDDWRATIGIFKDAGMKAVFDAALKLREDHRAEFYAKQRRKTHRTRRKVTANRRRVKP